MELAAESVIFKVITKCDDCGREITGELAINLDTLILADTRGFMVLADGVTCDECIDIPKREFDN